MDEYPRCVYRPGTQYLIWDDYACDMKLVADEAEHQAALQEGWHDHPSGGHGAQEARPEPDPEPEPDDPDPDGSPPPEPEPDVAEVVLPKKRAYRKRRRRKGTLKVSTAKLRAAA